MFEGDIKVDDAYVAQEWQRQEEERYQETAERNQQNAGRIAMATTTVIPYGGTEQPVTIPPRTTIEIPYA